MAVAFTRGVETNTEEATLFYGNEREADDVTSTDVPKTALFAWETRSLLRRRILQVVIAVLGIVIIAFTILAFKLRSSESEYSLIGSARFDPKKLQIDFKNSAGEFALSANIGKTLSTSNGLNERHTKSKSKVKYVASNGITLTMTQETESILAVNWTTDSKHPITFIDCFELSKAHWYGGSELLYQKWPLEKMQVPMTQYVPSSINSNRNHSKHQFGPVLERYWLGSQGFAIIVDNSVPLHVSINDAGNSMLCIKSDAKGYLPGAVSYLGYRIISGPNLKALHLAVVQNFLGQPTVVPKRELIMNISWIINQDSGNISQNEIGNVSDQIALLKHSCSYIVVRSQQANWSSGRHRLLKQDVVEDLEKVGCNIAIAVHPYIPVNSPKFFEAADKGYLINDFGRVVPSLTKWRGAFVALLDVTHDSSEIWFKDKLTNVGFNLFEFHGGDTSSLPACYTFYNSSANPGYFSTRYAKFASRMNGLSIHVGYGTQNLSIFVQMSNKDPSWDGLRTLIPTVLTFGIMGYPYILPSPLSGNHGDKQGEIDKELYIRWMQVSIFLPAVQMNAEMLPWSSNMKKVLIDLLKLRTRLMPVILEAFTNVTKLGAPIVRPLWWVAPNDAEALKCDSQFMLGDSYLVAPVLNPGVTKRKVYLPVGQWREEFNKGNVIDNRETGQWIEYVVDLNTIPYFKYIPV